MGASVHLECEPSSKKGYFDSAISDVKIIVGEIEALDALADEIGVRALGEFGLCEQDDEDWDSIALSDPKEAIESIEGLVAALRKPAPPNAARRRKAPPPSAFYHPHEEIIQELEELKRRLKSISRGKTRFRFVIVE